jgi:hypothetical protein
MKNIFTLKQTFMFIALTLLGITGNMNAQVTLIKPDATTASFPTISAAYAAVDFGTLPGAHTIQIESSYNGETTYPLTFGLLLGSSETNSVLIKPATGVKKTLAFPNRTIIATGVNTSSTMASLVLNDVTGLDTASYVIGVGGNTYYNGKFKKLSAVDEASKTVSFVTGTFTGSRTNNTLYFGAAETKTVIFNGAKYVTIDGVSRTDANTGLIIENPNCIYAQTIHFTGNAAYNTVKNCIVRGANQTCAFGPGVGATIFFSNTSFNTITMNDVCDMNNDLIPMPIAAIQVTGSGTNFENTISENNLYNISNFTASGGANTGFVSFGSPYNANSHSNKVLKNRMFWTKTAKFASGSTLAMIGTGGGMNGLYNIFEGNIMGYANANGTGTAILDAVGANIKGVSSFKNFTCKNNTIANLEINGLSFIGIELAAGNTATPNADDICNGNTVKNIKLTSNNNGTMQGIVVNVATPYNINIKNNAVKNLTLELVNSVNIPKLYGINYAGTYNSTTAYVQNYSGNEVSNLTAGFGASTCLVVGEVIGMRTSAASVVEKNLVYNLNINAESPIKAISITGNYSNPLTVQNNIVRIGTDVAGNSDIIALEMNANKATKLYHNTIYLGGQCAADAANTVKTRAINCLKDSVLAMDIQNNIICNKRSGGASLNGALYTLAEGKVTVTNNNLYNYNGEFGFNGNPLSGFAIWKLGTGLETGSLDNVDAKFIDATGTTPNMHLLSGSPADLSGADLILVVTDDFYGSSRSIFSPNDMGAVAYDAISAVNEIKSNEFAVFSNNNSIIVEKANRQNISIYNMTGQLVKSLVSNSDKLTVPVSNGFYIVSIGKEKTKVLVK